LPCGTRSTVPVVSRGRHSPAPPQKRKRRRASLPPLPMSDRPSPASEILRFQVRFPGGAHVSRQSLVDRGLATRHSLVNQPTISRQVVYQLGQYLTSAP